MKYSEKVVRSIFTANGSAPFALKFSLFILCNCMYILYLINVLFFLIFSNNCSSILSMS